MKTHEIKVENLLSTSLIISIFTSTNHKSYIINQKSEIKMKVRPYFKSELAQAYAPDITTGAALNRLAQWIKTNSHLMEALKQTDYRPSQRMFTSRQVALIFEYLGEP
jgi:hypothetical protein